MATKKPCFSDTKITARVPHEIYVRLKTHCAANRVDLKDVVTHALESYLKPSKKHMTEAAA